MFVIDLLNLKKYDAFNPFIGINKSALYRFNFSDHCILKNNDLEDLNVATLENFERSIHDYSKILLVTNLRSFGYIFNPISVYLCYLQDSNDQFDIIYEVGNTFGEQKYYFSEESSQVHRKNFYVSPFIEHQHNFKFDLKLDGDKFQLKVTTQHYDGAPILTANLKGDLVELTKKTIQLAFFKHPFINFKVIFLIHLQAFFLYLKKLRYFKKSEFMEHQTNYQRLDS
tara:strand:- start:3337 stop:4017 length:681 start_codon:yes stop_codon:yes gene_type:complete